MNAPAAPSLPRPPRPPKPLPLPCGDHAHEVVAGWIHLQGLVAVAMIVAVADAATIREMLSMLVRDVRHLGGTLPLTLRVQKITERLLELLATGASLQALDAVDVYRLSQGCQDCMLRSLAAEPIRGRCDACEARLERDPLRVAACASCERTGRNVDDTPCPDCAGAGVVFEATGEPAEGIDDDGEVIVDDEHVEVETDDAGPGVVRCETVAERFYAQLAAVTLPGQAVALWREFGGQLDATERDAARLALDEHVGRVGHMQRPAVWINRALMDNAAGAR